MFRLSGRAVFPDGVYEATLSLQDKRISAITRGADPQADLVTSGWIAPGLIDLQVNGAYGYDLTADSTTVAPLAAKLPATGITSFLPTVITSPLESYSRLLRDFEQAAKGARGAQVLGLHLEGPYLNPKAVGAHNLEYLRAPNVSEIEHWAGSPLVRLCTLAPELPGALEMIAQLRARNILVSAGHSNATFAEAMAGFDAGIAWGTHLFNAMSQVMHRQPGLVGALLSSDVPCGLIADGVHVHPANLKLAWRAKGARGLTLVTDAMSAMGMSPGQYPLGDREVFVDATSARLRDGTLAGSILQMDAAIRNMIVFTGCSLADAITMASTTPARLIGVADRKGQIALGFDADLVVFDESLRVERTIIGGEIVYATS
ncbi:MAG: N-acetylglucosamine-6-phosphate deacetylase [Chloroflexi bacterium]|nr:N-acetylglucosamine-6-phosphate deacetylase [Chloroflexota bacterium]